MKLNAADIVAGTSVAMVIIPQSLAYASLAGMPAEYGLYASAIPLIVFAFGASSRYLQTGPVALTSLLTFGALTGAGFQTETDSYVAAAALLALLVGVIRFGIGLIKIGSIAYWISQPVLIGFTAAAAVIIASSQMPKLFGTDTDRTAGTISDAWWSITNPDAWNFGAVALSTGTILCILAGRKLHKLFPGVLLAAALGITVGYFGEYSAPMANDIGNITGASPRLTETINWSDIGNLLVGAVVIAVVGFAECAAIARILAAQDKAVWNVNRELMASGAANLTAGVFSAFPIGGSFSRTSLNQMSGGTTPLSGLMTGLIVLVVMNFAGALSYLPTAVLGAIIVAAVVSLIKVSAMKKLWAVSKGQAAIAAATFLLTVGSSPDIYWGLLGGVALMLIAHKLQPPAVTKSGDVISISGTQWHLSEKRTLAHVKHHIAKDKNLRFIDLSAIAIVEPEMLHQLAKLNTAGGHPIELIGVDEAASTLIADQSKS